MLLTLRCPRCKTQQTVETKSPGGRAIRCTRCKFELKFVTQGKEKKEPRIDWAAIGTTIHDAAVKIGLVAFLDKLGGAATGTGIIVGACLLLGVTLFLVGKFMPEANVAPYGTDKGQTVANNDGKQDKDAQWATSDPLGYHQAKLGDRDPAVKTKSVQALGKMGTAAEPALGELLVAANDSNFDLQTAIDQALKAIGPPSRSNWKVIGQALEHKARPPRTWALRVLARPEHGVITEYPGVMLSLKDPDAELSTLAARAMDNFLVKDRKSVISQLFAEQAEPAKLYITQHLAQPGKATLADLPGLTQYLGDKNEQLHKQTVRALDSYPVKDRKSVLLALATEKETPPQLYVAGYLAGSDSIVVPETVPRLLDWLSAPGDELQQKTTQALANFGPKHADKVRDHPKLLRLALGHEAKPAKTWALRLLATPQNAVLTELPGVVSTLQDPDPDLSKLAAKALDNFQAKDRKTVISHLFADKGLPARLYVTRHLAEPGKVKVTDLPGLVACLSDPSEELRTQTIKALDSFPASERKSVLLSLAKEKEPAPRLYVARYVARPNSVSVPETIPNLVEWVSVPPRELQQQSALALGTFGPRHAGKIRLPLLTFLAANDDDKLADTVFDTVKKLGAPPRSEAEKFRTLTKDSRPPLRLFGWEMLARMELDKAEILKTFPPLLKEAEPRLRIAALQQIGKLGKDSAPLIPELKTLLEDREPAVRRQTFESFVSLAPQDGFTPIFLKATQEKDPDILRLSGLGLSKMPPLGKDRFPTLLSLLEHDQPTLRIAASRSFAALGKDCSPAAEQLAKALADEDTSVRMHVTRALTLLGRDLPGLAGFTTQVEKTEVKPLWRDSQHSTLPSLARFDQHLYVAVRQAASSKDPAGQLVINRAAVDSPDKWEKVAQFELPAGSRAPQLLVVGERLHLYWGHKDDQVSTSEDGTTWAEPKSLSFESIKGPEAAKFDFRTQHPRLSRLQPSPDGGIYCLARCALPVTGQSKLILLRSQDGSHFEPVHMLGANMDKLLGNIEADAYEADLVFLDTGTLVTAIRTGRTGIVAFADPPYQSWHGFDTGVKDFAGPALWKTRYGLLLACRALAQTDARCTVFSVTPTALFHPFALPSGGDHGHPTFAAGPMEDEPTLVYHSAQEGDAASIYLAKMKLKIERITVGQ